MKIPTKDRPPQRAPKAKQGALPGMEPPTINEIEAAADAFVEKRNAWQALKDPMIEARNILEALMKQHKLKSYEYDGKEVKFVTNKKIKVNKKKDTEDDDEDEDE